MTTGTIIASALSCMGLNENLKRSKYDQRCREGQVERLGREKEV
jgi:hypothetical protein